MKQKNELVSWLKWDWYNASFWTDRVMIIATTPIFAIIWVITKWLPGRVK